MAVIDKSRRHLRRRLTLLHDGAAFLDRWGLVHERIGGLYLHHIVDADPGLDLHDHPWSFVSIVLSGGYTEERIPTDVASDCALVAERFPDTCTPGVPSERRLFSVRRTGLDVAHRITSALPGTWTLVLRGPTRRVWAFYPPAGRVPWTEYDYESRRPLIAVGNHI